MLSKKNFDRLLKVAETGSIAKAASLIYISRASLVQQIKMIEQELGFEIFARNHNGVIVTEAGKHFLENQKYILNLQEQLYKECIDISNNNTKNIKIGVLPNLKSVTLLEICKVFKSHFPNTDIDFIEYPPAEYFEAFKSKRFDICCEYLSCYHNDVADISFIPLDQTKHSILASPSHPLSTRDIITYADLRGYSLMMYKKGITICDDILRNYIKFNEPDINIVDIDTYDCSLEIKCELNNALLLCYDKYQFNFPSLTSIPVDWNIPIELGIGYHRNCSDKVREFILLTDQIYKNLNSQT